MKILFLCNTLYQIIGACCIREMYPDATAEIVLTDHSCANKKIQENIQQKKLIFDKSYYVETKYLYEYDADISRKDLDYILKDTRTVPILMKTSIGTYDMFFCANAEPFTERMVNYIKHTNHRAIINWFEDGLSAYDADRICFPDFKERMKNHVKLLLRGTYRLTTVVDNYYVFQPDKMEWKPRATIKKIIPMERKLAKQLGQVFDYANCRDKYTEKYIFFEDGAQDWNETTDLELVNKIADIVGKDNILIKIHPRNPVNRFEKLGYKTNKDMSIPWEIIATNIDIENKVLMTMYSQSVVTSDILMGKKTITIMLGLLSSQYEMTDHKVFEYMNRQYFSKDEEHYKVPRSMDEFQKLIYHLEKDEHC